MKINETLLESFDVCRRNPLLFVPMLASVVIVAVLSLIIAGSAIPFAGAMGGRLDGGAISPEQAIAGAGAAFAGVMVLSILSALVIFLAHSMTVGMALDAVEDRSVSLKGGWVQVMERIVPLIIAVILVGLLTGIGMSLLILPGLIVGFFLMFTFASVMVERKHALPAIKTSFRVVSSNFGAVFVVFLVMLALGFLFLLVNVIIGMIPILGPLVAIVVSSAFSAFLSVFLLKAFLALREAPTTPDVEV